MCEQNQENKKTCCPIKSFFKKIANKIDKKLQNPPKSGGCCCSSEDGDKKC